jgi:VIT1/CCC1 family predicted Fe2+/Mn2+ transporter
MNYCDNFDIGKVYAIEVFLIMVPILMISQHFVGLGYSQYICIALLFCFFAYVTNS